MAFRVRTILLWGTASGKESWYIELFHGMTEDAPQTFFVLAHVPSKEAMDNFFETAG